VAQLGLAAALWAVLAAELLGLVHWALEVLGLLDLMVLALRELQLRVLLAQEQVQVLVLRLAL
jgi:hypothetical protein